MGCVCLSPILDVYVRLGQLCPARTNALLYNAHKIAPLECKSKAMISITFKTLWYSPGNVTQEVFAIGFTPCQSRSVASQIAPAKTVGPITT